MTNQEVSDEREETAVIPYEEKAIVLERHLVEREPLSDLCDKMGCRFTGWLF